MARPPSGVSVMNGLLHFAILAGLTPTPPLTLLIAPVLRTISFLSHADCFWTTCHRLLLLKMSLLVTDHLISFPTLPSLSGSSIWRCGPFCVAQCQFDHPFRAADTLSVKIVSSPICPGLGPQRRREWLISPASCAQWWLQHCYKPLAKLG